MNSIKEKINEKINGNIKYILIALFAGGSGFGVNLIGSDSAATTHPWERDKEFVENRLHALEDSFREISEKQIEANIYLKLLLKKNGIDIE